VGGAAPAAGQAGVGKNVCGAAPAAGQAGTGAPETGREEGERPKLSPDDGKPLEV
jgi:hypothetical protein